ncbi:beta-L-arabinofuranosidase domain-containing protein [Aquisphaera insulae]|uniref:beta-L-arabinofuranosidase domain-containing protein n=1 Tax=Aquisphaera insulae TaxID=2712864 RepID=UPI0013EA6843|nr:beta-L-arabinofuranosidase domain-containing protein [Aquisphaera insulae]
MILRIRIATVLALSASLLLSAPFATAQADGDQILDGIGETALIARYPLDGTAADRSRNGFHATPRGDGATFADDRRFGKALSLTGAKGVALELPAGMLKGVESISIVGWVRLRSVEGNPRLFSFERDADHIFACTLAGANGAEGFSSTITAQGADATIGPASKSVASGRWTHVAAVLDAAAGRLSLYRDGAPVGRADVPAATIAGILNAKATETTRLRVGLGLDGLIRDLRLYSAALSDAQVRTIHDNAAGSRRIASAGASSEAARSAKAGPVDFGGPKLLGVADVTATTTVGFLPKLPPMVPGVREGGAAGPALRVLWPAPKSADEVARPGAYTVTGQVPGTPFTARAVVKVSAPTGAPETPVRTLRPFALGEVSLDRDAAGRETPFIKNRDKFVRALARTNPDDFLYMFRDAFGQPQPAGAKALGVWDSQTTRLRGHATGHYLSALAQAYAGTTDDEPLRAALRTRMDATIDAIYALSRKSGNPEKPGGPAVADPTKVPPGEGRKGYDSNLAAGQIRTDYWNWGHGFLSAYPPDQFIMLERGATYGGGNNQIWAPYYTLHKILAGLLDGYEVAGNAKALEIARDMGLWSYERLKLLRQETRIAMWNRYIAGEYGGMNEVMARLHRLTGDPRFLEGARLFDNIAFFYGGPDHSGGLARNVDTLRGKHANQHIPQVLGALETFAATKDANDFRIAENFWDIATTSYAYSIGGVAGGHRPHNAECFTAEPDTLWQNGFSEDGQNETCATYNMLKLSRALFLFRPRDARYMDYYERALVNDILASVAEHDPGNTYHIPLNPGSRKSFANEAMDGFTCCNGTALESNTKLQDSIYLRGEDGASLYVNLFIPSTLKWAGRGSTLKQETSFPYADSTRLTLAGCDGIELFVRVPGWATRGFFVKIDGVEKPVDATPGRYISLGKAWKDGAVVELRMPFGFHFDRVMDRPNIASILYGPVVLAAEESAPRPDWRPLTIDVNAPEKSITGDPSTLRFQVGEAKLKPFFESYGRYSVYFDLKWEHRER